MTKECQSPMLSEQRNWHAKLELKMATSIARQLPLINDRALEQALAAQAESDEGERGAVFTKVEVVEFMLDLVGYTPDKELASFRILEPSFGGGDFLIPIVKRLFRSLNQLPGSISEVGELIDAVRAVEVHSSTYERTSALLLSTLRTLGLDEDIASHLCGCWLIRGDYLLAELDGHFDFVIGNPPYIRQELIPDVVMQEYRSRFETVFDRADIYVPFFEKSLLSLSAHGVLAFICADRWMKNRYGARLRKLVATRFSLVANINMTGVDAFDSEVDAYPSITVIDRSIEPRPAKAVGKQGLTLAGLPSLARQLRGEESSEFEVFEIDQVASGDAPWLLENPEHLTLVRKLEAAFPTLEEAGCKVGIGVATGADSVFIDNYDALPVEDDRKLPLAMRRDLVDGGIEWTGKGVVNPFGADGKLVDLSDFPKLARYLEANADKIRNRNVAKKSPANWYRTIDKIHQDLTKRPKLLIPDISGAPKIALEPGNLYPHHNLYFVTSNEWDLHALRAVLLSPVCSLFVSLYSTKMRGGYLRFQAQYLRRIRIPQWGSLDGEARGVLIEAGKLQDRLNVRNAVASAFALSPADLKVLEGF